jgi:CBS domain-containing protein
MNVHDIMSEPVVTCTPETTLNAAARLMRDADCGTLPVIDAGGHLTGIITDRDVCLAVAGSARNASHISVNELMKRSPVTVQATDSIHAALAKMKTSRVRRLPVLDGAGQLKGLLSMEDVVVRGLENGGIGMDEIVTTLRTMYERRPVASTSGAHDERPVAHGRRVSGQSE